MPWVSLFQFPLRISSSLFGLVNAKSEFVSVVSRAQACDYFLIIQRATFKDKLCWLTVVFVSCDTTSNTEEWLLPKGWSDLSICETYLFLKLSFYTGYDNKWSIYLVIYLSCMEWRLRVHAVMMDITPWRHKHNCCPLPKKKQRIITTLKDVHVEIF